MKLLTLPLLLLVQADLSGVVGINESRISGLERDLQLIQQDHRTISSTVSRLEERSQNQSEDINEISQKLDDLLLWFAAMGVGSGTVSSLATHAYKNRKNQQGRSK